MSLIALCGALGNLWTGLATEPIPIECGLEAGHIGLHYDYTEDAYWFDDDQTGDPGPCCDCQAGCVREGGPC